LNYCEISPSDPTAASSSLGISQIAAGEMERWLRRADPVVIGIGTGRTMRSVADQLPQMECPQHRLVGLVGTTKTDGSASFYDVIMRVSDTVRAPLYPMAVPVVARTAEERGLLTSLPSIRKVLSLVEQADATFVGVGSIGENTPLLKDGFISDDENDALRRAGAVGEITGWAFDARGRLIEGLTNERVCSAPLRQPTKRLMIGVAMGPLRRAAIRGALTGQLISGLVTDEATAEHLLRR
jgi:DNA-binding transcriptional regulator LsrR (DeoR family)